MRDEASREGRRREREREARLRYAGEEAARRAFRLDEAAERLKPSASPYRRVLGAVLGSRAWDAAVGRVKSALANGREERGPNGLAPLLAELERNRRARDRAARRLGAYREGTAQLRRAASRALSRRGEAQSAPPRRAAVRVVGSAPATIVFRIAAPDADTARRGGDYHLAQALAAALRARGRPALVETAADARREMAAGDVRIVLRGRQAIGPQPGVFNLLWVVSHPEQVTAAELRSYDHAIAASAVHARALQEASGAPVSVLLQFADAHFGAGEEGPAPRHDLLFVGNWRGVYRRAVWDAHCLGWRPALIGEGWQYIAPEQVLARHVPYAELPRLYRSARVLLVDHWDDMREHGYVANRVFDALASGAFVIADDVRGLAEMLPGGLETYGSLDELDRLLRRYLADPGLRRDVAERGREQVLASHTVEQRADELLALLDRLPRSGS